MRFKNLEISIFMLGGLILASFLVIKSNAYDDQTMHPDLTREIISFYELSGGKKLTEEQKQWIIQGSIDEDAAPRWLNHFYDPVYNRGLDSNWGSGYSAKLWAQYSSYQTAAVRLMTSTYFYSQTLSFGDFSYEAGIKRYSANKEKEAYSTLGHVLHLIEDMTVPEHTRNDPHPALNDKLKSDYEDWTMKNHQNLTGNLGKKLFGRGYRPVIYSNLENYFIQVANYSNKYFFGSHTINSKEYQNPKILWEDNKFGYAVDENGNTLKLAFKDSLNRKYKLRNDEVMQDYWTRLSRQAVINGAGVIQLFLNQAEAAKKIELQKKAQNSPKQSLLSQIINFFSGDQNSQPALTIVSESRTLQRPSPKIDTEMVALNLQSVNPIPPKKKETKPNAPPAQTPTPSQTQSQTQTRPVPTTPSQPEAVIPPITYTYTGGGGGGGSSSSNTQNQQTQSGQTQNTSTSTGSNLDISTSQDSTFRAGDLAINEIMYNPDGADDKHEWVEIYNNSGHLITLTGGTPGWRFNDGSNHLLNEPPTNGSQGPLTLPIGGYAILADNAVTFLQDYSGYPGIVIDTVMSLKNSTATIKLLSPDGTVIDDTTYYSSWGANGNDKTLERKTASGNSNDPNNWAQSGPSGGTPGAKNNFEISTFLNLDDASTTLAVATSTLDLATSTLAIATSTPELATSTLATATSTEPQVALNSGTDIMATTTITVNTTWTLAGSPYRLFMDAQSQPTIAPGATLTIEPGVQIISQGGNFPALVVQGNLIAQGNASNTILFIPMTDNASSTPQKGDWYGMVFAAGSGGNLNNVEFRYAVKAVIITDSSPIISNSKFLSNIRGVFIESQNASTTPQITNSMFDNNQLSGIEVANGASPIIQSNSFTRNAEPIRIVSAYPEITGTTADNNYQNGVVFSSKTDWIRRDYNIKPAGIPYILETNLNDMLIIDTGVTVTIEPGVILKSSGPYPSIIVKGTLNAQGATENPVIFTSLKDDVRGGDTNNDGANTIPADKDWANIKFYSGSAGNFTNTGFYYGGYGAAAVTPPTATEQLVADFPASPTWRQWGPSGTIGLSAFTANHNGTFKKVVIHDFIVYPYSSAFLSLIIKNSNGETVASSEQIMLSIITSRSEFPIDIQGNFIAGETYTPQITWTNTPAGIGAAWDENSNPAAAYYEIITAPASNPALSVDPGVTVIVQ